MSRPTTNRRRFLQTLAATGAAGMYLTSTGRAFAYRSPIERPVFATIGLRNQGWEITQKSFKFADFAAMADVDSNVLGRNLDQAAERQGKKPDGYADYRRVLEREDIDAVMIATPDHWHTKIAVEAMRAGKDVYCEKPLTLTIAEGKLIEKVVKETGRVFQVGTMQRTESDQLFLKAIALIKHGRIGKVNRVTCGINAMEESPGWRSRRRFRSRRFRKDSIGTSGTARLRRSTIGHSPSFARVTAAACRSTATAITRSATGTSTPAAS